MSSTILRSYQVYGADDQILTAAVEAVKKAVKEAKSRGSVQKVTLARRGVRQDIEVGDVYVVPPSVCNDPADFPTLLLNANLRKHTTGEGMVEFQMGALADPKELSRESLQAFKKVCFANAAGDTAPLIVFAASWAHPSAYQSFAYDEDTLLANLRDVAYASPHNPSLSSALDQLRAVDHEAAPYAKSVPVTQHIFSIPKSKDPVYPTFAKGLNVAADESGKTASLERRASIRLRAEQLDVVEGEDLSPEELAIFQSIEAELGTLVHTTAPKEAAAYVDPMPMQGETGMRAQPDYGAPDSKEQIHPAMVDGPDPKTASEDNDDEPQVPVTGLVPDTPTTVDEQAVEGAEDLTAQTTKEAAFAQDTVQSVNKFVSYWAGQLMNGQQLKAELGKVTDRIKDAVIFMKDQGLLSQDGPDTFKVKNRDMVADEKLPTKRSYVLRNTNDNRVWAAQAVDGLILGGEWTHDRTAAFRFASLQVLQEEARRHMITHEAKVAAKTCKCDGDCECADSNTKTAGGWWSPGSVMEQFYPELLHNEVGSPFLSQEEDPNIINPFGAPGKEVSQHPEAMGVGQGLDGNVGGVPLRQEMNIYGPDYARSFYAPKDNMAPSALKLKKHPLAASHKQADGALALFQGLSVATPEEHPQAHFDETAPDGQPGAYVEPAKEDSVPQSDAFLALDSFLKGIVAAYAAQLIGAFKATSKPLTLGTPYTDTLDLSAALEFAGGAQTADAIASAKAQFVQALGGMNDDQRQMLLDNAVSQAAVWCPNTQGSGGFNYEVFVRAEKLDGTSLVVKVVTGAKGGR